MSAERPRQVLSVLDAVAVIVGVVLGAGIFRLPSLVAAELGNSWLILAAWLLGGLISLIGALCFGELTSTYPHRGGEYHFLTRAYGRSCGFMFAWARMTIVQTGSVALLALIFGDYAAELLPLGPYGPTIYAVAVVAALTALNMVGVRQTATVQKLLFAATLVGLASVILAGIFLLSPVGPAPSPIPAPGTGEISVGIPAFGFAMVLILLTYGGWNEAAYISAEVRNGRRNVARALIVGIATITLIYVAINFVYLYVLGVTGMAESQAIASDVMHAAFGPAGATAVTVLILIVILASTNVTILTGARTNFALGQDFPMFGMLARWSSRRGAPIEALLLQGTISLALVLLSTMSRGGIETVVEYLSPVFWLFFLLTGFALFVLRWREPGIERPFSVPFYPLTPILFCLTSGYLLFSSLSYTGFGAAAGVTVLLAGLPVLLLARRRGSEEART
jgi:basic amino acid/polyamine antiporter, APA family